MNRTSTPGTYAVGGAALIALERQRQIDEEGWTPEHDDEHPHCELSQAAKTYITAAQLVARGGDPSFLNIASVNIHWPWEPSWWKPSDDPIRNLVKAGALIAAEIDRLERHAAD